MSTDFELAASIRNDLGKGATRRLRRKDKVPAIIYGADSAPVSIALEHNKLLNSTENEAFFSHIIALSVDGKKENVIIKDLQRHPSRPVIMHADFLRVSMNDKLRVNVPIHFIGEDVAVGVKAGGVVTHELVDIEVECMPADLPEYIEIDISDLDVGTGLHLSDVKTPKGVEIVALMHGADHDSQVVSIHVNRASLSTEDEETEESSADEAKEEDADK